LDDVIVVGAGPAGNCAALGLASQGLSVTVIDGRHVIGDKLCTGIVGGECTRRFPIDPALVYHQASAAQVMAPQGGALRFEATAPQASVVDRVEYVNSFARQAQAVGARYYLGHRVVQAQVDPDGVTVVTGEGCYRARCLVLAAGFGSPLVRQLGLGSVPDYVIGAQAMVSTVEVNEVEVHLGQQVAPGFFSWLVPTRPGQALVGLMARRQAAERLTGFIQSLSQQGKVAAVERAPACWGVPLRPLKRTYADRVVVVGDAAGQVKPITGGGIYYSLMAGDLAASVVGQALAEDDLSPVRLSQYQDRWQALLATELDVGYWARRLYELLNDQQIGFLLRSAAGGGSHGLRAQLADGGVSFDWHSRVLSRLVGHPALSGALHLLSPLLCRLTPQPDEVGAATRAVVGRSFPDQVAHGAD
jgi:geranylgeranyl reductase family protein